MLPATAGNTVLVMLHPSARTFSIPPAYLARFPNTTHWRITVEPDGIKVSPEQAPPPVDYDEPTQEEIQAAIAETRAANSVNSDPQHAPHRPTGDQLTRPNHQHPDWTDTGPPCDYLPTAKPAAWHRLLNVQTAAETLQSLSDRRIELERQQYDATSHALRIIASDLEQEAGKHSAALASGTPPTKPTADTVAAAKLMLANARQLLPKPDAAAGNQEPDPWHDAIAQIFHDDILMTTISNRRDEYLAAGPEAAAAWRQTIDQLAHQCRHHDDELRTQTSQTPSGPGRRARRRLLAQATGASRSALHAYHEAVAGPRRTMPVRFGQRAQLTELHHLLNAEQIRQIAASDAAPIVMIHLEFGDPPETTPALVVEHQSELHVLLPTDTMPPGLPAETLTETHLAQDIQELLKGTDDENSDTSPPHWALAMGGPLIAAAAGIHDADPQTLQRLGSAIRTAVKDDPHAISLLQDATTGYFGALLETWIFSHCQLLVEMPDEWDGDIENVEKSPFYTPEQNQALLDAGAAAGISPYGLKRLAVAIGADTEPDYTDQLPQQSPATATAVHTALRQAIPDQPQIRQALAHILHTELGIPEPAH